MTYYSMVRKEIISLIPHGTKRILDVGCANGDTGLAAKSISGVEQVIGIELFKSAAQKARGKLDGVIVGDVEQLKLKFRDGYFDCIICADVLEHTKDPWQVLIKLRRYLSENGVLIASIPNIRHIVPVLKILFDRLEYDESGVLDRTHLRFFTLHTIRKMFEETGFNITRVETNRSVSWKFKLLNTLSLGLMKEFAVYQYIVVAKKTV